MSNVQPAIKQETKNVAIYCLAGMALMFIVFFVWNRFISDKVPFDYTVILGGVCGSFVALLNFFLMGMTVQKVVSLSDTGQARKLLKFSYTRRFILQMAWCVIAIFVPCFQMIAGIIPLLFPSLGIKGKAIFFRNRFQNGPSSSKNVDAATDSVSLAKPADNASAVSEAAVPANSTAAAPEPQAVGSVSDSSALTASKTVDSTDDNVMSFREV